MPLEILPDHFDDATHNELDKAVNETVEEDIAETEDLSALHRSHLLSTIIEHCDDLDSKYGLPGQAKKLIKTHGELRAMLASAWKHKSYRDIRSLGQSRVSTISIHHLLANKFSVMP